MKKIGLFLAGMFIGTNLTAQGMNTNELFLGPVLGFSPAVSTLVFKHHTYDALGKQIQDHDHGNNDFAMTLNGAYRFSLANQWILGPQLHVQYNLGPVKRITVSRDQPLVENNTAYWNYGIAGELGYAVAKDNLLYLLLGPDIAMAKSHYTYNNPVASGNDSSNLLGVMLGIGAEQCLFKKIHLGEQLNYGWFNNIVTNLTDRTSRKDRLRLITAMINFSYQF